jgi:hypothetical protein
LFHIATFFGSCISRILHTGCAKIKKTKFRRQKVNVWFILEFYITQILISTTSGFETISRLIKVTDNSDARWKLEINEANVHPESQSYY